MDKNGSAMRCNSSNCGTGTSTFRPSLTRSEAMLV